MTAPARSWRLATRLGWRLAAVMAVGVLLAAGGVAWRTLATIHSLDDAALQSQAGLVADQIASDAGGRPVLRLPAELAMAFEQSDGESLFLVCDAANAPLFGSSAPAAAALAPFLPRPPATGFFRAPPSASYPNGLLGVLIARGPWRVAVAQAHEQQEALVESLLREFLLSALWLLVPIGAATVAIGVRTLRHGLRPLREASAAARRIGPAAPGVRLPAAALPLELAPLVGAVNMALERLERALDAQRRFAGEAAHALRTPLAVLTARIDALPAGAEHDALHGDADRLARLVAQMLAMSRLDGLPLDVSMPVDLRAVAAEAIAALAPLAVRRGVELELTGAESLTDVHGNAAALEMALANLIDNAIAHSPPGATVSVSLAAPADIRVGDRGPGVPAAERAAVFDRFHSRRAGGAGLGLAIVAGVAAAHGGSAWVEPRDGGGAVFVLRLGPIQDGGLAAGEHGAHQVLPVQPA